ncbi:MAG: prepilin peptidase [Clostridioides difficile]|nr:prepilin peptidase [Clostridioides difficile]
MIKLISILIVCLILSYLSDKVICFLCGEIEKNLKRLIVSNICMLSLFLAVCIKYGKSVDTIKYLLLIPFILIVSIIDIYSRNVYDLTVLSGIMVQGIIFIISLKHGYIEWSYVFGLIIGVTISYILAVTTKSLGYGDVGFYGLCCFALGREEAFYLIGLSFLTAFFYYIVIFIFKRDRLRRVIPFTPFISLATIIIILTENRLLELYVSFLYKIT